MKHSLLEQQNIPYDTYQARFIHIWYINVPALDIYRETRFQKYMDYVL